MQLTVACRGCCASFVVTCVETELTLVKVVRVHRRLTLITLARDVARHLNGKTYLVEIIAASVERGRLKVLLELLMLLLNRAGAVSSS